MEQHRCMGCMAITENAVCEKCGWPMEKTNEPHQLPVGYMLRGQYTIGRVLGQGGFGITYLGWDTYLDLPVAIKEFYPNSMVNRECSTTTKVHCYTEQVMPQYVMSKERFLREAKALAKFEEEPAIVRIRNFFQENDTAYIVMEYVRGTSLAAYVNMRGGKLSAEETLRILKPVIEALTVVHEANLVHRDISPDNIMLHPRGGAKLLDFGAVRSVENAEAGRNMPYSTEAILKHGFAPMEQYQSRGGLGPWTDEYALCATIYYCLTGRIPEEAPRRMLEEIDLDWDIPGLLPHQQEALRKGTALRAKDRYGTVRELMDVLYCETQPVPEPEKPTKVRMPKTERDPEPPKKENNPNTRKKKRLWLIPVIAAVLAAVVFLLVPDGWKKDWSGSFRCYDWGVMRKDAWVRQGDLWYHMGKDGTMDTGFVRVDDARYYFGTDGVRVTGWQTIGGDRYYFGTDGVMVTGFRELEGEKYLFLPNGIMATGWQEAEGKRFFFDEEGRMVTGWLDHARKRYYLNEDGTMFTGWMDHSGGRYYFGPEGNMSKGWEYIDGYSYCFGQDGKMLTGIHNIDGIWHDFGTDGKHR